MSAGKGLSAPVPGVQLSARVVVPVLLVAGALALGPLSLRLAAGDRTALLLLAGAGAVAALAWAGLRRLDLLLWSLNLCALALLPAIHHRSTLGPEQPSLFYGWTVLRVTAPELLAAGAIAADVLRRRAFDAGAAPRVGLVPWLAAGFLGVGLLAGLLRGNELEACLRDGRKIAYVALAHWLVVRVADDARRRRVLAGCLIAALALRALTILVSAFFGQGFRYSGFLRASVDVGDFLGCLALIYLPAARLRAGAARGGERLLCILLVTLGSAATIATFSRAAWCAAPVGLAVLLLHKVRAARAMPRALVGVALVGATALPLVLGDWADRAAARLAPLFAPQRDSSVSYRLRELRGAAAVVADHPVAGVGLGTPFDAGASLIDRRRAAPTLVHNVFLWSAVKAGLIGLLAIGAILAIPAAQLSRAARAGPAPDCAAGALGLLALLAAFVALGMAGGMLNQARVAFALGALTGFAQSLATRPGATAPAAVRRSPGVHQPAAARPCPGAPAVRR